MKNDATFFEKLALLALAGFAIVSLTIIAVIAEQGGKVDATSAGLLGMIVTGLIALATGIISAIRAYSMSAQLGKVTDQLAKSAPLDPVTDPTTPQQVEVVNATDNPVPVDTQHPDA